MLLAILLGPYAAFLSMASILTVQALFFADGGLLALGCNIFNLGFFPCFVAYPFIYRKIVGQRPERDRILLGAMAASVLALQMGAFSVVLETRGSGISELPFSSFVLLMQPVHLAIGIVEGLVTAAVVSFIWNARPEVLEMAAASGRSGHYSVRNVLAVLLILTVVTGGALSWFASTHPDGLEWSMFYTSGSEELESPADGVHPMLAWLQEKTAFLPDYGFKGSESDALAQADRNAPRPEPAGDQAWPAVNAGTSVSGLVGGAITLFVVVLIGFGLRRLRPGGYAKRIGR